MKRQIKHIVVHSTATSDAKVSQHYGLFHWVVERSGEIKKIHPDSSVIKNIPEVDNEAIHIAYVSSRNKPDERYNNFTKVQEESLFNKLVALSVKYPGAKINGHNELDIKVTGFSIREWLRNYEPDLRLPA